VTVLKDFYLYADSNLSENALFEIRTGK